MFRRGAVHGRTARPTSRRWGWCRRFFYFHVPVRGFADVSRRSAVCGVARPGFHPGFKTRSEGRSHCGRAAGEIAVLFGLMGELVNRPPWWGRKAWGVWWILGRQAHHSRCCSRDDVHLRHPGAEVTAGPGFGQARRRGRGFFGPRGGAVRVSGGQTSWADDSHPLNLGGGPTLAGDDGRAVLVLRRGRTCCCSPHAADVARETSASARPAPRRVVSRV